MLDIPMYAHMNALDKIKKGWGGKKKRNNHVSKPNWKHQLRVCPPICNQEHTMLAPNKT